MALKLLLERLRECGSLLQIALDFTGIEKALAVASQATGISRAIILEAGTPLIKGYGSEAISILRALQGDHLVMADMKTMDTGALEVSIAASRGAHASSVLAVAPRETIAEAVSEGDRRGVAIYGDMIGHRNPLEASVKLQDLRVDVALFHIGVDVQEKLGMRAGERRDIVEDLKSIFKGPIAVAGGIKPGESGELVAAGADIVIIGGAITRSHNPRERILEALRSVNPRC